MYLNKEYKHKRIFHSIVLSSLKIDFEELVTNLIGAEYKKKDRDKTSSEKWLIPPEKNKKNQLEVFLTEFIAPVDFAKNSESTKDGGLYAYYIYFIKLPLSNSKEIFLISSPFINMAKYLCLQLKNNRDKTRGKGIHYQKMNIDKIISALSYKQNNEEISLINELKTIGDGLNMTGLIMQIFGDPRNKIIGFKGKNVPSSDTYQKIVESLDSIRIINYSCNILFAMKGLGKSAMEFDRFGRFTFRIGEFSVNLHLIHKIFKYLYRIDAIDEGSKVPHIRSASAYWELQNSQNSPE